jgi:hypothetical protein
MLTSNIAEPDTSVGEVVWTSATYAVGDQRILTTTHKVYECVAAGSRTISPDIDTINWIEIGPTNKWAMFDLVRSTTSTKTSDITITINPNQVYDAIALLQLTALSAIITCTSVIGGGTVYTNTINLHTRKTFGWYSYFFDDIISKPNTAAFGLPTYSDMIITIVISNGSDPVLVGGIVIGRSQFIGYTQLGASSQALNFSTVDRDAFGNAIVTRRRSIPKTTQTILAPIDQINKLKLLRDSLNAVPAVWSGLDDQTTDNYFDALLIMGIYREFTIIPDNVYTSVTLELEEV